MIADLNSPTNELSQNYNLSDFNIGNFSGYLEGRHDEFRVSVILCIRLFIICGIFQWWNKRTTVQIGDYAYTISCRSSGLYCIVRPTYRLTSLHRHFHTNYNTCCHGIRYSSISYHNYNTCCHSIRYSSISLIIIVMDSTNHFAVHIKRFNKYILFFIF